MKRNILTVLFWLIPIALMTLIFCFSAQTAEESTEVSRSLGAVFLQLFAHVLGLFGFSAPDTWTAESIDFWVRKIAHFTIYAALGGSLYHAARFCGRPRRLTGRLALLWCVLYSLSDEFHQWFVSGRSGQLRDILIDSVGAVIGILFIRLLWRGAQKRRHS